VGGGHVTCVSCDACPFLGYISDRIHSGSGTSQFSVGDSHGKFVVEEEYKKWAYDDLTCDLKILYVLQYSDIENVWFSKTLL
jgi:hypothetical protein